MAPARAGPERGRPRPSIAPSGPAPPAVGNPARSRVYGRLTAGNRRSDGGIQGAKVPPSARADARVDSERREMDRPVRIAAACALFALAALVVASPAAAGPSRAPTAPSFTLPTAAGSVSLDSLQGKVVLVDFWASWCVPCKSSFPWMNAMQQRYGKKGLAIVAINVDKSRGVAEDFIAKHPAAFTVAFDPLGQAAKAFRVWGMPTSFLIGPDRSILFSRSGFDPKHAKDVEAVIAQACAR